MGQAKRRGTVEERKQNVMQRIELEKPEYIECNNCHEKLTNIVHVDTKSIKEIEIAFCAHCSKCNHDTWAIRGDPNAISEIAAVMEMESKEKVKTGSALPRST